MSSKNQLTVRIDDKAKLKRVQNEFSEKTGLPQTVGATIDFALATTENIQSGSIQRQFAERTNRMQMQLVKDADRKQLEMARSIVGAISSAKDASPDARIELLAADTSFAIWAVMPDESRKKIYEGNLFSGSVS